MTYGTLLLSSMRQRCLRSGEELTTAFPSPSETQARLLSEISLPVLSCDFRSFRRREIPIGAGGSRVSGLGVRSSSSDFIPSLHRKCRYLWGLSHLCSYGAIPKRPEFNHESCVGLLLNGFCCSFLRIPDPSGVLPGLNTSHGIPASHCSLTHWFWHRTCQEVSAWRRHV